ncbi:MAG: hypothetical protein PWP24_556 [Clostridiales bacterium]|nr:hypothetical protein [Clostridiales bacterium]
MLLLFTLLTGCSVNTVNKDKVRDLTYTIVPEEDVPEELKKMIDEKKSQAFQLSYAADNDLYLVVGYGEQESGGYSITLEELYATEDAIIIRTKLLGPDKEETAKKAPTYPYIVVKTEFLDLPVEYEGLKNSFVE